MIIGSGSFYLNRYWWTVKYNRGGFTKDGRRIVLLLSSYVLLLLWLMMLLVVVSFYQNCGVLV